MRSLQIYKDVYLWRKYGDSALVFFVFVFSGLLLKYIFDLYLITFDYFSRNGRMQEATLIFELILVSKLILYFWVSFLKNSDE